MEVRCKIKSGNGYAVIRFLPAPEGEATEPEVVTEPTPEGLTII